MIPLPLILVDVRCVHCRRNRQRPPGSGRAWLCWGCYQDPDVRAQYPPRQHHLLDDSPEDDGLPPEPTTVPPGKARVPVYAERAEQRHQLQHPLDVAAGYEAED